MELMDKELQERLTELAEPDFQKFSSRLLPGVSGIIGVRLSELRKIARKIAKDDWRTYLDHAGDTTFEETMLQGLVIGYAKAGCPEILQRVKAFVPKIDNWSVCDSFCSGLKIAAQYPREMWDFLQPYLMDDREYYVRFGVVMLLYYYIEEEYLDRVFVLLDSIKQDGYYVRMAIAWAISACYIKFQEQTADYLLESQLDNFTFNKALQKITESTKVNAEEKDKVRAMKRKQ